MFDIINGETTDAYMFHFENGSGKSYKWRPFTEEIY
jgi:hypothetical protein